MNENRRAALQGRSELVRDACAAEWGSKPSSRRLEKARGNQALTVTREPEFIRNRAGDIIGVDAWVQLYDAKGNEVAIDPHRRIINPPTVPRSGVRWGVGKHELEGQTRAVTADPGAAFWEAVWDSVQQAPNPNGWRTRGTVTTVYSGLGDGTVRSNSATYANARSGSGATIATFPDLDTVTVGQIENTSEAMYYCYEMFVEFDLSGITAGDMIVDATLDLWLVTDNSGQDFTVEARHSIWGPTLETSDYVPGASLSGLTLLASQDTATIGATGSYKTLTSAPGFLNPFFYTLSTMPILVSSSRLRLGNTPATDLSPDERVQFSTANVAGTTQDPRLTITHTRGAKPLFQRNPPRIWRLG